MRAGLLTETIAIYKPFIKDTKYGKSNKVEYIPYISSTRARVQNERGTRTNENNEIRYQYTVTFTIRGYHIVDNFMRIKWKNRFYRILNIIPPEQNKNEIVIETELVNE